MTTIKTIIQWNTNSLRTSASETLTSDFSNIHQTTNGVFVKQTTSDISKRNTGMTFPCNFRSYRNSFKNYFRNLSNIFFVTEIEISLLIKILITCVLNYGFNTKIHDIEMWIISAILDGLMVIDKKKTNNTWQYNNSSFLIHKQ